MSSTNVQQRLANVIIEFETGLSNCKRAEDRAVVARYLAELGHLLAAMVVNRNKPGNLTKVDRLMGHTWLVDATPFQGAIQGWQEFCDEYHQSS